MATVSELLFNMDIRGDRTVINGFQRITREMNNLQRESRNNNSLLGNMAGMFASIGSSIKTYGLDLLIKGLGFGVGKLKDAMVYGVTEGIKFNATMEQQQVALTTLTGNEEDAKNMLKELVTLSANTPFNIQGLAQNAKTLMGYGVEQKKVLPDLAMLGDVASATGGDMDRLTLAFAQVTAKGKLQSEEVKQMVNNGFNPLQIIAETTGLSMKQLDEKMRKGAITSQMVEDAFKKATSEGGRFYNAMENASKTLPGQTEKLKEYSSILLGKLTEPLYKVLAEKVMPVLINFVLSTEQYIPRVQQAFQFLMDFFISIAVPTFEWIKDNWKKVILAFKSNEIQSIIQDQIKPALMDFIDIFKKNWPAIKDAIKLVADIFTTVFAPVILGIIAKTLPNIINFASTVILWIGKIARFVNQHADTIKQTVEFSMGLIYTIISTILDWTTKASKNFLKMLDQDWSRIFKLLLDITGQKIKQIGDTITNGVINFSMKAMATIINFVRDTIKNFTNFKNNVSKKIDETRNAIVQGVINFSTQAASKIINFVKDAKKRFTDMKTSLTNKINELKSNISSRFSSMRRDIINRINSIKSSIINRFNSAKTSAINQVNSMVNGIKGKINSLKSIFSNALNSIKRKISGTSLYKYGVNLINGFINGLKSKLGQVKNIAAQITNTIKNFVGFRSPTKEGEGRYADEWMPNLVDMLVDGLNKGKSRIAQASKSMSSIIGSNLTSSSITNSNANVIININGANMDINQIGETLVNKLRNYGLRPQVKS